MTEVGIAEQRLRDLTNHHCRHEVLYRRTGWLNFCSALDVLGDTNEAVEAFSNLHGTHEQGLLYLHLHGLLQVLYLQSDAADEIQSFLGLKRRGYPPEVQEIRRLRDQATGHPTRQGRSNAHFIVRVALSRNEFTVYSFEGEQRVWRTHRVDELVTRNTHGVCTMLSKCEQHLLSMSHLDACTDRDE